LLDNLPNSLPEPQISSYSFINFVPDTEKVEEMGDIGALNQALEVAFGWQAWSTGDGIIPITE
jgi:hypothetical protein